MLIGEKTKIRSIYKADLDILHRIYREPDVVSKFEAKAAVSLAYLEKKLESMQESEHYRGEWLVIEDNDGNIIGSISYNQGWRDDFSILNLYIDKQQQGKGYATDVVKRLVKFIMEEKCAKRIEVQLREDCVEAVRVFEKAGFFTEGKRRKCAYHNGSYMDETIMSIVAREYFA